MEYVTICNRTQNTLAGTRIGVADTARTRLIGLLGHASLDAGSGLLIRPSSGVHTFGMRFTIDVVALDRNLRVHSLWPQLRPWRLSGLGWKIHSVLELPAGAIREHSIHVGDQLEILTSTPAGN